MVIRSRYYLAMVTRKQIALVEEQIAETLSIYRWHCYCANEYLVDCGYPWWSTEYEQECLSIWDESYVEKMAALEVELDGLNCRLEELMA